MDRKFHYILHKGVTCLTMWLQPPFFSIQTRQFGHCRATEQVKEKAHTMINTDIFSVSRDVVGTFRIILTFHQPFLDGFTTGRTMICISTHKTAAKYKHNWICTRHFFHRQNLIHFSILCIAEIIFESLEQMFGIRIDLELETNIM